MIMIQNKQNILVCRRRSYNILWFSQRGRPRGDVHVLLPVRPGATCPALLVVEAVPDQAPDDPVCGLHHPRSPASLHQGLQLSQGKASD